ncbi:hypothetical protein [Candidatus Thiosymbion oneisti]|uniref:hypothetical protein n=1 Tax=Candidatus Thiosymbion oneisti TaxID=589554 RepID=UPI00105FFCF8|nr:hypothetical protein [Candidatus Thiosymbion oneisti]
MISRSLLLNVPDGNIADCLKALGITRKNISSYEQGEPFLEAQENGALVSSVKGDFTHTADVFLFDRELQAMLETLAGLSLKGILAAMPDDDDDDPEVFFLWRDGRRRIVRIYEDEATDRLRILDPLGEAGLA